MTSVPADEIGLDAGVDADTAADVAAPADRSVAGLAVRLRPWLPRLALTAFALVVWFWPAAIDDPTRLRQWAEYLCIAIVAIGIDIAWGYGGMLVLGQGVFFGLGAYAMGMYLSLEQVPDGAQPEFMSLYADYDHLPLLWRPFGNLWFAAIAAVVVPMLLAAGLGWLVFNRRIRGPYFAILTQVTALVFWLLLVGQLELTAGTNGLTNFVTVFGRNKYDPDTVEWLYRLTAVALIVSLLLARQLVNSRFGKLLEATRDGEDRVRFLGYNPAVPRTVAFTVAAGLAGLGGALAAPIIGIVAPNQFAVLPSILLLAGVAFAGRGLLYPAVVGALLIGWGGTAISESRPDDWLYLQGALFVLVMALAPGGLWGLITSGARRLAGMVDRGDRAERTPSTSEGVAA